MLQLPIFFQVFLMIFSSKTFTVQWLPLQTFLDFCGLAFHNFWFTKVYNSILFSFPLVLPSNLDLHGCCFRGFLICVSTLTGSMEESLYISNLQNDTVLAWHLPFWQEILKEFCCHLKKFCNTFCLLQKNAHIFLTQADGFGIPIRNSALKFHTGWASE